NDRFISRTRLSNRGQVVVSGLGHISKVAGVATLSDRRSEVGTVLAHRSLLACARLIDVGGVVRAVLGQRCFGAGTGLVDVRNVGERGADRRLTCLVDDSGRLSRLTDSRDIV